MAIFGTLMDYVFWIIVEGGPINMNSALDGFRVRIFAVKQLQLFCCRFLFSKMIILVHLLSYEQSNHIEILICYEYL